MATYGKIQSHRPRARMRFRRQDRLALLGVVVGSLLLVIALVLVGIQRPLPTSDHALDANEGLEELERLVDQALIPGDRTKRPFAEAAAITRPSERETLFFGADMATDRESFLTNISLARRLKLAAVNPLRSANHPLPGFASSAPDTPYLGPENHDITDLFDREIDKADVREITAYSVGIWSLDFERRPLRTRRDERGLGRIPR